MLVLFEKKINGFLFYVNIDFGKFEKKFCVCLLFYKYVIIIKFISGFIFIIFIFVLCDFL